MSKSLGVPQYRTEPRGAGGESTLLSSLHDSGIDLLLTVASRVYPCSLTLSSLIVVLGVLRLTMFFGVRIYISSLWPWLCHNIFNVVRIALLFFPLSFFFLYVTVSRMFVVNSVFRRCTRCQWLFSVLRCRPMLVVASLRDGNTCIARFCDLYQKLTRIRFAIGNTVTRENKIVIVRWHKRNNSTLH